MQQMVKTEWVDELYLTVMRTVMSCHANVLYNPHYNSDLVMDDLGSREVREGGTVLVLSHILNNYHIATVGSPRSDPIHLLFDFLGLLTI